MSSPDAAPHDFQELPLEHHAAVTAVALSPDQHFLASGDAHGAVVLTRLGGGRSRRLSETEFGAKAICWSPDSQCISALFADGMLRTWDRDDGALLGERCGEASSPGSEAFSNNGEYAICGGRFSDTSLILWDTADGHALWTAFARGGGIRSVAYGDASSEAAAGNISGCVAVFAVYGGRPVAHFDIGADQIWSLAFSPDGTRLAAGDFGGTLHVVQRPNGQVTRVKATCESGRGCPINALRFINESLVATVARDGRLVLWRLADTIQPWAEFRCDDEALCLDVKHRFVAAGTRSGTRYLLELRGTVPGGLVEVARETVSPVRYRLLRRWRVVKGYARAASEWTASYFEPPPLQPLRVLRGHEQDVLGLTVSRDGRRVVSGSFDKTIRVWDVESGSQVAVFRGHRHGVGCVGITPDGLRVFSGDIRGSVRMWDVTTGEQLAELRGHAHGIYSLQVSDDGLEVETWSGDDIARVWDAKTGACTSSSELPGTMWVRPDVPSEFPFELSVCGARTVVTDPTSGITVASYSSGLSNLTAATSRIWAGSMGPDIYVFDLENKGSGLPMNFARMAYRVARRIPYP